MIPNPDIVYIGQLVIISIAIFCFTILGWKIVTALNANTTPGTIQEIATSLKHVADGTFKMAEDYAKTTESPIDDAILAVIRETVIAELNRFIPTGSTVTVSPPTQLDTEGTG